MKKVIAIILIIVSNLSHLQCADNYELGDILYVWAKSGLNVRVGPGTDNHIIAKIPFGESVLIWGKTDKTYNVVGIDTIGAYRYPDLKIEPVIFKGNWVQIQLLDGQVGYVIDQYLLRYKPKAIDRKFSSGLNLEIISTSPVLPIGEEAYSKTKTEYEGNITVLTELSKYSIDSDFSFYKATIEEVLVFLSSTTRDFADVRLSRNWKDEVIFSISTCHYTITQLNDKVLYNFECSC